MVVLAVSISTKTGKVLVSRQFVDITRSRIESLLAAFPKLREALGDTGKQHTLIETSSVRYLYQKLEELYLVVITSKQSNIVEDLATLQIFSRVLPEYCGSSVTERTVVQFGFDLVFAFDEVVALGYKENISKVEQIRAFTNMESQEEMAFERAQKDQEREAKEIMKRRMKEIEKERKEREQMGLPSFSGPGSANSGYGRSYSSNSSTVVQTNNTDYHHAPLMVQEASYKEPERKVRRGINLGKKPTSSPLLEQLQRDGEHT